jgi:hypothetical protein
MLLQVLMLVTATQTPDAIQVSWQDERNLPWTAEFSKDPQKPLITAIKQGDKTVVQGARPFYWIESGKRRGGFDQFFDFPPSHPEGTRKFMSEFKASNPKVTTKGDRVEVSFDGLAMGHFTGRVAYTFYPGTRLVQQEAIVSTREPDTAFYYDAGIGWAADHDRRPGNTMASEISYYNTEGKLERRALNFFASERQPVAARYRAIAMRSGPGGAIAAFPAPHQYFMPRDFTSNLEYVWARSFRGQAGLGIRQLPDENWVYYPWMNAPPGTEQRLSLFLQLSAGAPGDALDEVLRYTHRDRFPALPGYKTVAPHWHFAYTMQAMEYGEKWVPPFKPVLKEMGIDAAIIADFHGDGHPRDTGETRLKELEAYFRMTKAQSDAQFLIVPGEEANIHLGGHWIGVFPKPVYWYMARAANQPFVEESPRYGKIYRTANPAEMLDLIRRENALVYTAHPRTKGSMGFPDKYKDEAFFKDDHFLGAGFKAMPSDLSTLRQGVRALNLVDDMNNWGQRKKLIGETDMFQVDHTHELYAHMNANYVKLDRLPAWDNYGAILDVFRRGDYFVSQGTVLLPSVKIDRRGVTAEVHWTFPLGYALVITDSGKTEIPLDKTGAHGKQTFTWNQDLSKAKWARIEVWDIAGNGAFINPVWF